MTAKPGPWQYDWKRPEWGNSAGDGDDFCVDGIPVSAASAQVSVSEFLPELDDISDKDSSFLLVSTLYSTRKGSHAESADVLLLEIFQHKRNGGTTRLKYRMLRWPGSTIANDKSVGKKNYKSLRKAKNQKRSGLIAVALCRLPSNCDERVAAMDAMDVLALMSLGLETSGSPSFVPSTSEMHREEEPPENASDVDESAELTMACLTTDGRVLFYNPLKIVTTSVTMDSGKLENELAKLLFGNDIHQQLEQSVLPLSQPLAIVSLSVPLRREEMSTADTYGDLEAIPEDLAVPPTDLFSEEDSEEKRSVWEGSYWDADVEISSAKFHTVDNSPRLLIPAFQFIAVAGNGTRIRKIKRRRKEPSSNSRASSVSSWETASQQEETWELGTKTRSNTVDSLDSKKEEQWRQETPAEPPLEEGQELDATWSSGDRRSKTKWVECKEPGGFITFISLRYTAESRTVYLPFAPKQLSAIVWGGMHFVIVLGDERLSPTHAPIAVAIRVDSFGFVSVPRGEVLNPHWRDRLQDVDAPKVSPSDTTDVEEKPMCTIRRFQPIPILLPSNTSNSSEVATAVAISSTLTDPPGIVLQHSSESSMSRSLIVTLSSFLAFDLVPPILIRRATGGYRRFEEDAERALAIRTSLQHGQVARISHGTEASGTWHTWCTLGQGWSLMGVNEEVYFICWEGSSASGGAFTSMIHSEEEYEGAVDSLTTLRLSSPVISSVLPLYDPTAKNSRPGPGDYFDSRGSTNLRLPFTTPYTMPSFVTNPDLVPEADGRDIIKDALDSLAFESLKPHLGEPIEPHARPSLTYKERSVRLVRHCSSWTLLGDTEDNKAYYDSQVPVMVIQYGPLIREKFVLSLRKVVVDNATASPFNQVLGWLSQSKDYFTAATVALDLLRDVECLRNLVRAKEAVAADSTRSNLDGILEGIIPLYKEREESARQAPQPSQSVLTQLADMSVGCLLKGGLSMSATLEIFVQRNPNYDPGRACLMLVSAIVSTLSRDPEMTKSAMGVDYKWPADNQVPVHDLVWPLRSLFQVGVSRDYLAPVMQLLNAALPDDLRNRGRDKDVKPSQDSLQICTTIVSMVVASSAADLLLDLKDEVSGHRYWQSLDQATRLKLALLFSDGFYPLLQQAEVRSWLLNTMDTCIESSGSLGASRDSKLPTEWLKTLCKACLVNAGCDLEHITRSTSEENEAGGVGGQSDDGDGTKRHFDMNRMAMNALSSLLGPRGLDFGLFIPTLLLLVNRDESWSESACLSTQSMLDAACNLAGQHRREEAAFPFDGTSLMRQCAMSGNISAGANLIGGKNGLVLHCSAVLIRGAEVGMDDAEDFILNDDITESTVWAKARRGRKNTAASFVLTDEHRNVLWLLEEYVLSISTYGDFVTSTVQGKVDPVFAARACLRTWLLLSLDDTTQGTAWLVDWLRLRLDIEKGQVSPKRLVCSALTCALLWPSCDVIDVGEHEDAADETLLARLLDVESGFLVDLSQSCCGLVEAVPPSVSHKILGEGSK